MKCDSSQGGSVMECPTCFQKITVPQAPAQCRPEVHPHRLQSLSKKKFPTRWPRPPPPGQSRRKKNCPSHLRGHCRGGAGGGRGLYFFSSSASGGKVRPPPRQLRPGRSERHRRRRCRRIVQARLKDVFTITGSGADIWRTGRCLSFCLPAAERRRLAHGGNSEPAKHPRMGQGRRDDPGIHQRQRLGFALASPARRRPGAVQSGARDTGAEARRLRDWWAARAIPNG